MAAQDKNSFAEVWEQLDAKYAERVRVTDAAALGDEEIVRRWSQIGEGYLSRCMTALSLFTDASNSKPQLWVKDPVVGREVFPGTYRLVTVDVDVQKPGLKGIIQTLRKGFATTPQWAEARIERKIAALSNSQGVTGISGTTSDPIDQVFEILFPNCSPLSIEAIADALRTADYSGGITVRGETHSGAWHVLSVSTKIEEDGSASATLRIATPQYTISAYDDYGLDRAQDVHYVMDVPKEQVQGIVTAWKAANSVGASATISYSRDQKLVDVILRKAAPVEHPFDAGLTSADCRYTETETIYLNVASISSYPITAPTNGLGISYDRNVVRNANGTWDISIKTRTARYRDSGPAVVEVSAAQSTQQRQQLGVTNQAIEAMVETPGVVKSQRVEIRDDCSKDVTTNAETGKEQISVSVEVSAGAEETTTEKTYQAAPASAPVAQVGHIKAVKSSASKYPGRYDTSESDREVKLLTASSAGGGPLVEEVSVVSKNADADLSGESAGGDGVLVDTSSQKNEAGKFDNRKTVRTAKEKSQSFAAGSPLVAESVVITKNGSVQSPGTPAEGTIHDASNSINDFGKIDSTKVVRTAIQKQKVFSTGGGLVSEQVTVTKNGEVPNPGTGGAGVITDASASVNEFGKVDSTVSVKTAKTATATSVSGGPLAVETEVVTKNGEAQSPGAGGVGTIKRVGQSVNEFGKVDSQVSTIVAVQSAPALSTHGSALVKVETETVKNGSAVSPGQGAAGQIIDVNQSVNEFGKIDSTKTKRTAVPSEIIGADTGEDEFRKETTDVHVHKNSIPVSRADGEVVDANIGIDEFGKISGSVRKSSSKPVVSGPFTEHDDGYKKTTKTIHRNVDLVPAVPADDNGHDISVQVNEYGKKDVVETKTAVSAFDIDIDEPSTGNQAPRYQRICYGLRGANEIQPKVNVFKAKVAAQTGYMYRISASVHRDENGFYIVTLTANPKDSSGGGGSSSQWEAGLDVDWEHACLKYSDVSTTKAVTKLTSSRSAAQTFINTNPGASDGLLVDRGVAGQTGCFYIGRGRFIVVKNYKAS